VRSDGERIAVVAAEPVAAQTGACWRLSLSGNTCLLTFSAEGTVVAPLLFQVACAAPACEALIGALAQ
jgi:hypothetical protein